MAKYVLAALVFFTLGAQAAVGKKIALVYAGPGVCEDGNCVQNAADVAIRAGYSVRYIKPEQITAQIFHDAKIWIQPGGDSIEASYALNLEARNLIRTFVYNGGGYLGFCAGGYLAAREIDTGINGLGLLEGEIDDQMPGVKGAFILPILWNYRISYLYFEEGPNFVARNIFLDRPIAHYSNGNVAVLETSFGKGHVSVSGPHPEAPPSWRTFYQLQDNDGLDYKLAHELFNWAVDSDDDMEYPTYSSETSPKSAIPRHLRK